MSKILALLRGAPRLVRQVESSSLPVMGGIIFSRHNHNEPPPGSCCSEDLVKKSRETPDRLTDTEWREVLSSVQYQVTRRHGTEQSRQQVRHPWYHDSGAGRKDRVAESAGQRAEWSFV